MKEGEGNRMKYREKRLRGSNGLLYFKVHHRT